MNLADKITVSRIIMIPVFVSLLSYSRTRPELMPVAVAVAFLAMLSDFLDGLVARIKKEKSDIGQVIDPIADKCFLLAAFVSLYVFRDTLPLKDKMPPGIVLVVVSRDLIIILGIAVLHFLKKELSILPSVWGKLTTFFQMAAVLWLLLKLPFFPVLWGAAILFTLISGTDYFLRGVRAINNDRDSTARI